MSPNLYIAGAAVFGAIVAYNMAVQKGVKQEQYRVEAAGKKVDAKAQKARVAAVTAPDVARVLQRHCRDCGADLPVVEPGNSLKAGPPHKANR